MDIISVLLFKRIYSWMELNDIISEKKKDYEII